MAGSRQRSKRQTRLKFDPIPASSTDRLNQPEAIRDRVARVEYAGSVKSRKDFSMNNGLLPTPSTSSQPNFISSDESDVVLSKMKHSGKRKRGFMAGKTSTTLHGSEVMSSKAAKQVNTDLCSSDSDPIVSPARRYVGENKNVKHGLRSVSSEASISGSLKSNPIKSQTTTNVRFPESDESDVMPTSRRRNSRKSQSNSQNSQAAQEEQDLQEDLDFLDPSASNTSKAGAQPKSARRQALDNLKRKRAQPRAISTSSPHDEVSDANSHSEAGDAYAEHADDGVESDFVVEDDEESMERPIGIPFEFRLRTMKPKDLFKFAIDWMVQNKLNPGFEKDAEEYRISFMRLDDFARGMGGSKYQSAAWTPEFLRSLRSRPVLIEDRISGDAILHDRCGACNRSGHPATFEVRFEGSSYDSKTLENDSESEDDSFEESSSHEGIPYGQTYYLGKFCMRNARVAHTLVHWRYHLNEWVLDYLTAEGHCTASKLVERDTWKTSKRRKYADEVLKDMEERGEIKALYRNFKDEIGEAHEAVQPRFDYSSN